MEALRVRCLNNERKVHILRELGVFHGEDDGQVGCRRIRDVVAGKYQVKFDRGEGGIDESLEAGQRGHDRGEAHVVPGVLAGPGLPTEVVVAGVFSETGWRRTGENACGKKRGKEEREMAINEGIPKFGNQKQT